MLLPKPFLGLVQRYALATLELLDGSPNRSERFGTVLDDTLRATVCA